MRTVHTTLALFTAVSMLACGADHDEALASGPEELADSAADDVGDDDAEDATDPDAVVDGDADLAVDDDADATPVEPWADDESVFAPEADFVAEPQEGIAIATASGSVEGVRKESDDGALRVFKGIPFAEPPIGERRFADPVPVEPWDGVLVADEFGPGCPQGMTEGLAVVMGEQVGETSEDCLTLNVWAHDDAPTDDKRPVMVWIYGGGFVLGGSNWPLYEMDQLARQTDAVIVSVNYRLGALGFLATPELAAENGGSAGNWALKDQALALKWVQENIAAFGGDQDNVTIFGESAGAISACSLLGAPSTDGLFHKAIVQSGMCAITLLDAPGPMHVPSAFEGGASVVEAVGWAWTIAPTSGFAFMISRWNCHSDEGRRPPLREPSKPIQTMSSTLISLYGSEVGVISIPSPSRTEMLPEVPWLMPDRFISRHAAMIASRLSVELVDAAVM